jgi:eukaryotic-like serine/threonine-protein kinase
MAQAGGAPIDRYVVLEHLSEGGMGAIYVGKKLGAGGFEMEVVLKQLLPEFTEQEEFIDLFLREAKLSATLDHANIIHTIDLVTAGGEYFIVMEYLAGGDLRTLLKRAKRRGARFSPAAAIYIAREVLAALAYAHVKRDIDGKPLRLIHRDVSPSNILVSHAGEVKLTDFGIAKAATHNSLFYKVKGKIGYMSPEQAKSEPLDNRADLYSLAVCLYEIITGEKLFVHVGLTTSADAIYSQPVPPVSRKVPGLHKDLDAVMAKALAISPTLRYQTAGEFNEALTRCAHRHGLLMSAPELAQELSSACGPFDQWRDEEEDESAPAEPRAGTEVYDPREDEEASMAPLSINKDSRPRPASAGASLESIHALAARADAAAKLPRAPSELGRFQGVELTSMINLMDLEAGGRASTMGSHPLVDLDVGPALSFDSNPPRAPAVAPPVMPVPTRERLPLPVPVPPGPSSSGERLRWAVIIAIVISAGVAATLIATSGPDVPAQAK